MFNSKKGIPQQLFKSKKAARWEHFTAKTQEEGTTNVIKQDQIECACKGFAWLRTTGVTITEKYNMEMLTRHDLWRVIEGERTKIRCRRCTGSSEPKLEKQLRKNM